MRASSDIGRTVHDDSIGEILLGSAVLRALIPDPENHGNDVPRIAATTTIKTGPEAGAHGNHGAMFDLAYQKQRGSTGF